MKEQILAWGQTVTLTSVGSDHNSTQDGFERGALHNFL